MPDEQISALRRLAFQVAVVHDLDLQPADSGIVLSRSGATVEWDVMQRALGAEGADSPQAGAVVHRLFADVAVLASQLPGELAERARPVGVPVGATYHPGEPWVRLHLLGGALDFGLGFLGLHAHPDRVDTPSPLALEVAGVEVPDSWWAGALDYLEAMGKRAVERLSAEPLPSGRQAALRPIGDADVLTLLGSREFRRWLAGRDGTGMGSIAVPMRRRGWVDLRALDPAFIPAAAATIDAQERGFSHPLLVTVDEVAVASGVRT